jgi:hypothetical protein
MKGRSEPPLSTLKKLENTMARAKITQKGVFNQKGEELEVGSFVDFKGDTLPRYLEGKAIPPEAELVVMTDANAAIPEAEKQAAVPAAPVIPSAPATGKK